MVILNRSGVDFRGTCAQFVHQDDERAVIGGPGDGVVVHFHPVQEVLHLDNRTAVDKQAGHADSFVQQPAAVIAQVHDHAVHVLLLEVLQDLFDVLGGAAEFAAATRIIRIERRKIDDADLKRLAVGVLGRLDHFALGPAIFQHDLIARENDAAPRRRVGRLNFEFDLGAGLAANLAHHLRDAQSFDIHRVAVFALGHGKNLVADFEPAVAGNYATRNDFPNYGYAVFLAEQSADAFERGADVNLELFDRTR